MFKSVLFLIFLGIIGYLYLDNNIFAGNLSFTWLNYHVEIKNFSIVLFAIIFISYCISYFTAKFINLKKQTELKNLDNLIKSLVYHIGKEAFFSEQILNKGEIYKNNKATAVINFIHAQNSLALNNPEKATEYLLDLKGQNTFLCMSLTKAIWQFYNSNLASKPESRLELLEKLLRLLEINTVEGNLPLGLLPIKVQLLCQEKNWKEAIKTLQEIMLYKLEIPFGPAVTALELLNSCYMAWSKELKERGQFEEALVAIQKTTDSLTKSLEIADLYEKLGNYNKSKKILERSYKKFHQTSIIKAYSLLPENKLKNLTEEEVSVDDENLIAKGNIYLALEDYNSLEYCLNNIHDKQNLQYCLLQIQYNIKLKNLKLVEDYIEKIIDILSEKWLCKKCFVKYKEWHYLCINCGLFNTINYNEDL